MSYMDYDNARRRERAGLDEEDGIACPGCGEDTMEEDGCEACNANDDRVSDSPTFLEPYDD